MEIKKFGTRTEVQPEVETQMEGGIVKPNVLPEVIEELLNDRMKHIISIEMLQIGVRI